MSDTDPPTPPGENDAEASASDDLVAPTRRDVSPTRRDATSTPPTSRDITPQTGDSLIHLPSALRERYAIERELGAGGAEADLLVVRDRSNTAHFVVKIYRRGITVDPQLLDRVAHLDPKHVVRVVDWGESDGRWYEVLEYLPEGSLADLLAARAGPLDPGLARDVVADLAAGLRELHQAGVVHRDLKPANVLIRSAPGDRPRRVLGDFGLAVAGAESLVFLSASRTAAYAAPEAASGAVGPARDYWSLGIITLEMLTGTHPFAGLSEAVISAQLATRPIDTEVVTDPHWRLLCRGLLVRDPRHRWAADEVAAWLDGAEPEVHDEQLFGSSAAQAAYRIGDAVATDNQELARALADNWIEAKDRIGRNLVLEWLERNWVDTNAVADAHRILSTRADAEVRLYRLVRALDPEAPPSFRGVGLDPVGLGRLADGAAAGEEDASGTVRALLNLTDVLRESGDATELPDIVQAWVEAAAELREAASRVQVMGGPALGEEVVAAADARLLNVTVAPEGLAVLRRSAEQAATDAATEQGWYATLGSADDAPAPVLLLLALLAADAERETTDDRTRRAEEAEHDERLRRRREEFGSDDAIDQRIAELQARIADTDDIGSGLMVAPFIWFAGCLVGAAVLGLLWLFYKAMGLPGSDGDAPVVLWVLAYIASAVFALRSPALKMRNRIMTPTYRSEIARLRKQRGCGERGCTRCPRL